jgi:hypothetical protein
VGRGARRASPRALAMPRLAAAPLNAKSSSTIGGSFSRTLYLTCDGGRLSNKTGCSHAAVFLFTFGLYLVMTILYVTRPIRQPDAAVRLPGSVAASPSDAKPSRRWTGCAHR